MRTNDREEALAEARRLNRLTHRKHVVRNEGFTRAGPYFVCPLFEEGREGYAVDAGYAALGAIVQESLHFLEEP